MEQESAFNGGVHPMLIPSPHSWVGAGLGGKDGAADGFPDGGLLGDAVGLALGEGVGGLLGDTLGKLLGAALGSGLGRADPTLREKAISWLSAHSGPVGEIAITDEDWL